MAKLLEKVGCLRLHTAGLVVGWLGVVGSFLAIIISSFVIGYADTLADFASQLDEDEHEKFRFAIVVIASIYLGSELISGVVSGLLIYGTKKNRHLMILPWLILHGLGVVLNALSLLAATLAMFLDPIGSALNFILGLLLFALYYYIYLGIYSLYKNIQRSREAGQEIIYAGMPQVPQTIPPYSVYGKF